MDTLTLRKHPETVERWRAPMRRYWKALHPDQAAFGVDYMLFLMWHESRGNPAVHNITAYPDDPGQQASGLMQHKPVYWLYRLSETIEALRAAGISERWMDRTESFIRFPVLDDAVYREIGIFHPKANMAAAVWLYGEQGWQAWSPSQMFPPEEYEIPRSGKGVWWVDELGGYRLLRKGGVST